jgi:single-stranded-DNA-specific exonuclease
VAAKLVERFARPAVVVGFKDGVGRGSLRTTGGFHLHAALVGCAAHLQAYGGHAAAAGMTITRDSFAAFTAAFAFAAAEHRSRGEGELDALADATAELHDLDVGQAEELARLGPFGSANPEPLVALSGLTVRSSRVVGQKHLQLTVSHGGTVVDGIGFGMAASAPIDGSLIDALACPEVDEFRGYKRARLRFKRIAAVES